MSTVFLVRPPAGPPVTNRSRWGPGKLPRPRNRWLGFPATIGEGITWAIEPKATHAATTDLRAHVWATFPSGLRGRILQVLFNVLFRGWPRAPSMPARSLNRSKQPPNGINDRCRPVAWRRAIPWPPASTSDSRNGNRGTCDPRPGPLGAMGRAGNGILGTDPGAPVLSRALRGVVSGDRRRRHRLGRSGFSATRGVGPGMPAERVELRDGRAARFSWLALHR